MRRQNQTFGRFLLSAYFLLQFSCTTVSQLQRTSNSACGNIVCPKELVQYECEVGSGIDTLVWRVSGCGNALEIVYQQGMDVQQAEGSCEDGQSITADLQQINASFFRSTLNITGVRSNLTIQCSSDDGSRESLIGMDKLISTAPVPNILQQPYTNDSRIVVTWDSVLRGCSSLHYNYTQSNSTCGTCELTDDYMVTCTNSTVNECSLAIQTFVCDVLVNESIVTFNIIPESSPAMPTNVTTSGNNSLSPGKITTIIAVVVAVVVSTVLFAIIILCVCMVIRYKRGRKGESQLSNSEECRLELSVTTSGEGQGSGSGEIKERDTLTSNNATGANLGELNPVDSSTPKRSRRSSDPVESEVSVPPPANTLTPANSNGGLRGEESEANVGGNTEDRNGVESTDEASSRQIRLPGVQEGYSGSVEEDQHACNVIDGEQLGPANRKALSHTSPGSYHSQPSGGEGGGTNPGGDVDFPSAVEESSPPDMGVDSGSKEQVAIQKHQHAEQILPSSGIKHPQPFLPVTKSDITETSQDNKQNHQCTEPTLTLPSSGAVHQPSLTNTVTGITETSQEPTSPFIGVIPVSGTHRSAEPKIFHIPSEEHFPAQQETEGRSLGATESLKHPDVEMLLSKLQSMDSKLESMQGNKDKIEAVEKRLDEEIKKRDNQINSLEKEVSKLRKKHASLEKQLQNEREKHKQEIQTLKEEAASQLQEKQDAIDQLTEEKEKLKAELNKRKRSSFNSQWDTL